MAAVDILVSEVNSKAPLAFFLLACVAVVAILQWEGAQPSRNSGTSLVRAGLLQLLSELTAGYTDEQVC